MGGSARGRPHAGKRRRRTGALLNGKAGGERPQGDGSASADVPQSAGGAQGLMSGHGPFRLTLAPGVTGDFCDVTSLT
jgi:hypothetical protein